MKISTKFLQSTMTLVGIFAVQFASAQCPAITCPGNQTVNNTPGTCGAVVTYATPVGTNPCGGGGGFCILFTGGCCCAGGTTGCGSFFLQVTKSIPTKITLMIPKIFSVFIF